MPTGLIVFLSRVAAATDNRWCAFIRPLPRNSILGALWTSWRIRWASRKSGSGSLGSETPGVCLISGLPFLDLDRRSASRRSASRRGAAVAQRTGATRLGTAQRGAWLLDADRSTASAARRADSASTARDSAAQVGAARCSGRGRDGPAPERNAARSARHSSDRIGTEQQRAQRGMARCGTARNVSSSLSIDSNEASVSHFVVAFVQKKCID